MSRIRRAVRRTVGAATRAEHRERDERPEARYRSAARPSGDQRRLAHRKRADGRVVAGDARTHCAEPPPGLVRAVGGAHEQDEGEHVRLLARGAERAVQRLVTQMVEQVEREP